MGVLLGVAGLARSTFFYHQARLNRPDPQSGLKTAIVESFTRNRGRYGHRRIHIELVNAGFRVAKKTVLKLMRALRLRCVVRRKKRYSSYRGQMGKTAPNLLSRDFTATAPNQKWVTDITEFRIGDDKLYLSAVMDLFDRQIIAYRVGTSPNMELVLGSLKDATGELSRTQRPLIHSDQGFQYQHAKWRTMITQIHAIQSMSHKGNCLDNAMIENFFGHLKEELFHHTTYPSIHTLEAAIHDYIRWYNNDRISTTLNGLSPAKYRIHALAA